MSDTSVVCPECGGRLSAWHLEPVQYTGSAYIDEDGALSFEYGDSYEVDPGGGGGDLDGYYCSNGHLVEAQDGRVFVRSPELLP